MKNKYLIFDLDRTLFDTDFLIKLSGTDKRFNLKIAQKINWGQINLQKLIYPGVLKSLLDFQKKGFNLFLYSKGDIGGQLFKLKVTGLNKFFPKGKRFIVTKDKEKNFKNILKIIPEKTQAWVFDDQPTKLKAAREINNKIKTVLVCHGPWWQTKIARFKPDYKVKDLREMKMILGSSNEEK